MEQDRIRNFVITAHIDHGKSTLADRFLELTHTVDHRKMHPQYLDQMALERERGITIKMQPVRMIYEPSEDHGRNDHPSFILNLIDTPGHVDFSYEVSRALAAVEGAILLVDATKGVQAQTIANLELARAQNLAIVPAVNKIDLPQARRAHVRDEIAAILGIRPEDVLEVSAKEGRGVAALLERVVRDVPPPSGDRDAPLRALVFDSHYDDFRGIVAHVRIVDGAIRTGEKIRFLASAATADALEVGVFRPAKEPVEALGAGEIGYIVTGIKDAGAVRIGDTVTTLAPRSKRASETVLRDIEPLPGYREPQPVVYAALFPENADDIEALRDALEKLRLNDASLAVAPEESHALGRGFRCGFLGTLHLEIVVERLRREFNIRLIVTHPSVVLSVRTRDGKSVLVRTPRDFPSERSEIFEPWVHLEVIVPPEELSSALRVIGETRGRIEETETITSSRLSIRASVPLLDIIEDFADRLKSATRGFASFAWQPIGEREGDLVKLSVFVAHEEVEALAQIVPRRYADAIAHRLAVRLKETVPQQLFPVAIQVAVDGRIIARETIPALRKDVTAPLYGGDFTRKKKLLVKQRRGKKRLEKFGRVRIPPETFLELLKKS
jgi:GTP-binding protein LepA